MREALGKVLLVLACLCLIALVALVTNAQKTRQQFANKTPVALNQLLQTDHAEDLFAKSLRELKASLTEPDTTESDQAFKQEVVKSRFEILWTTLDDFAARYPFHAVPADLAESTLSKIDNFIDLAEPHMASTYQLTAQDTDALLVESNQLAISIRAIGRGYYVQIIKQADAVDSQVKKLYGYMRIFIMLLLLTGGLGIGLLVHTNRRTNKLFYDAKNARSELALTVDELRSGKREQKAKDSFIASASHDLRQPLHALGLFLNNLDRYIKPEGREALAGAMTCKEDLNLLFNSILDLSRLDAGFVNIEKKDFNLRQMVTNLHSELQPKAEANNIKLRLNYNGDSSFAQSDPILINRITRNLLENAITHSEASVISLTYDCIAPGCAITISDDGCGIPKSEHEAIFTEFYQLNNPERDRSKGMGLGLSIVKRLTSLLNLKLEITSSEDAGTQFRVVLPRSDYQPSLEQPIETQKTVTPDYSNLAGAVVVVVDDDANIRKAMHMMLSEHGMVSVCAETSDEALEALAERQLQPDIIIADYRLREHLTGDVVINELQEAIEYPIPGLIITGDTSPQRMATLKDSGFDILHKPVEAAVLHEKISDILDKNTAMSESTIFDPDQSAVG